MPSRRRQREERRQPEPDARDYVIARLGIARREAQAAVEGFDEALLLFSNPEDDSNGKEREEELQNALESLGRATRAAEAAEEKIDVVDHEAGEPWDEGEDDA